ncbi:MAG: hypothetical protein A2V65_09000 [Deltaproteobacteria bacterium RBG_13_49_15]|nr:MAG: hypothetical protein A2V65_09000 [Deltaproteobacteria bacterium RBG_13_49_15]
MIIRREGIGELLADGVLKASQSIGNGSERFAVHAGGQELPMHDSRFDPGYAIAYQCEPTPGRHTISCYLYPQLFGVKKRFPAARRMIRSAGGKAAKNARLYAAGSVFSQILNGCGMCLFGALTGPLPMTEYLNAATGWGFSPDEYWRAGLRILALRKAFNVREGVRDQSLHDRALGKPPLDKGPLKGITVASDPLVKEFFEVMGWDPATGGPAEKTLKDLGIDDLVKGP